MLVLYTFLFIGHNFYPARPRSCSILSCYNPYTRRWTNLTLPGFIPYIQFVKPCCKIQFLPAARSCSVSDSYQSFLRYMMGRPHPFFPEWHKVVHYNLYDRLFLFLGVCGRDSKLPVYNTLKHYIYYI